MAEIEEDAIKPEFLNPERYASFLGGEILKVDSSFTWKVMEYVEGTALVAVALHRRRTPGMTEIRCRWMNGSPASVTIKDGKDDVHIELVALEHVVNVIECFRKVRGL